MRLDGYGLFVKDMAAMIRFYRDVLGFEIKEDENTDDLFMDKVSDGFVPMSSEEVVSKYIDHTNLKAYATKEDIKYHTELITCFEKYITGNWGDLCEEDKQANEDALINNERLLASYLTSKGKVYIITERDRSCTTILFANEY